MSTFCSRLTDEQKARIKSCIDAYEWKHSWHLPHDSYGIDWGDIETVEQCLRVLVDYESSARAFADKCAEQVKVCREELGRLKWLKKEYEQEDAAE